MVIEKNKPIYLEDESNISIDEEIEAPLLIKEESRYGFIYLDKLFYVKKDDATLKDNKNSDERKAKKVLTLTYHFIHDPDNPEEDPCNQSICQTITQFESHLKFLKDNYKNLAEGVIKAVLEYKGIPYVEPEKVVTDTYKVVKGDTLYGIALKLDTTVDELKKINGKNDNIIAIGEILKVPTKLVDTGESDIYTVKSGDTLYSIANKYGITVKELKALNDVTSDSLKIGQLLKVPSGLSNESSYTVLAGDTLYSIAKKFDTTVDKIKEANKLTSNMLNIGDKLIIPIIDDTTYVVQAGDTLYNIARRFKTTVAELKRLNNLVDDVLAIGKILIVK